MSRGKELSAHLPAHFLYHNYKDQELDGNYQGQLGAQFGAVRSTCIHAASAIGPIGECGAKATSYVSV